MRKASFWAKKDCGAAPGALRKGKHSEGEDALTVAKREFEEETCAPQNWKCKSHPHGR